MHVSYNLYLSTPNKKKVNGQCPCIIDIKKKIIWRDFIRATEAKTTIFGINARLYVCTRITQKLLDGFHSIECSFYRCIAKVLN